LLEFGTFSGLQCNVNKTVLMQIGNRVPPTQEILDLGFTLVDEIKILGMTIDHSLSRLDENFESILASINKTIAYWKRFRLTVPGRINITKSLLVSLVNYLGCFIMPKHTTLNAIQKSIDDFIIGDDKIARNRLYLPPESGGLGCFKLDEFLYAQQCVWTLKAEISSRDNWRVNLRNYSHGNCMSLSWRNVDPNINPIIYGFGKAFEKLRTRHDGTNENYLHATVLYNPLIFRGPGDKLTLDPDYLEVANDLLICKKLSALTVGDCYGQFGFISRVEFRINFDIDLSLNGYANLGRAVNHFVNRLTVNPLNDGSSISLLNNLQLKKPGTKIRAILANRKKKPFNVETLPTCKTFFEITVLLYVGNDLFSKNLSLWNRSGFTNRQRTFFYKFYNNTLGLNVRTSHFVANGTRICFFCSKHRPNERNDETFIHLFFNCPTVRDWHSKFLTKCFPELPVMDDYRRKSFWFLGYNINNYSVFIQSAVLSFQFWIWEAKLKKLTPSFHSLFSQFYDSFCMAFKHSVEIRKSCLKINYTLCRSLLGNRQVADDGAE
jgi:hypothetical protein